MSANGLTRSRGTNHERPSIDHRRRLGTARLARQGMRDPARRGRGRARIARQWQCARRRTGRPGRMAGQPVAQEGRPAVVPSQRQCHGRRRQRRIARVRQGAKQILRLGRRALPHRGVPGRPRRDRPPRRAHRRQRRADAKLRQHRRLCRRGHHGRHLGDRRQLRPDRQERPHLGRNRDRRRARAVASRPGDHRGRLLHRRAQRGRRGRRRRARRGDLDGGVPRRLDQDRRSRHRRGDLWPGPGLFGGRPGYAPRQGRRPEPGLRGHRQTRR